MELNKLKKEASLLQPLLRIGKKGINENIYTEVKKLLKTRSLVKIKILNNSGIDEKEEFDGIIKNILEKTGSELVSKIGKTFTIYKKQFNRTKEKTY